MHTKVNSEKHEEQITLLMCGRGTAMKIHGHTPKIQTYAFSLCWAIFIAVAVFKWNQGERSEKHGFSIVVSGAVYFACNSNSNSIPDSSRTSVLIMNLPSICLFPLAWYLFTFQCPFVKYTSSWLLYF